MNLEIDRIKKILKQAEAMPYEGEQLYSEESGENHEADMAALESFKILAYHYRELKKGGFVDCIINEATVGGGVYPRELRVQSFTSEGQDLLEALRSDTLMAEIKATGKTITIEVLKEFSKHSLLDIKYIEIPAADRIVPINHNSLKYIELLENLKNIKSSLEQNNSLKGELIEEADRVKTELTAGKHLLTSNSVRVAVLWSVLGPALIWLLDKFAGQAIEPVIKNSISLLKKILEL